MRASATFGLPSGDERSLGHGDLIGRLSAAALRFDDPAISEAHALVSLRGGDLKLLALRGLFAIDGRPRQDAVLRPGLRISLSREIAITVLAVVLPDTVLGLQGDDLPLQPLGGAVSLVLGVRPSLRTRYQHDADAWLWWAETEWRLRVRGQVDRALEPGQPFQVNGRTFEATSMALNDAGEQPTRAAGGIQAPLTIRARFDTVHLLRERTPPLVLTGQSARILSELATVGVAIAWEAVAATVWSGDSVDSGELRRRWDIAMVRLRGKLRDAGIRPGLVRADGSGCFELVLAEGDVVVDET